jgi:hypothetical protein
MKAIMSATGGRLRQGKIGRRFPQDLIGLPQFAVLALQRLDPLPLVRRWSSPLTLVPLGLPDPVPQRLARTTDLGSDRADRRILRAVLALVVKHHPDRTLANLR